MKKIKVNLLILAMLGMMCIFSTKTQALSPPYLSLNTTQNVVTDDNAVLHASLINTGKNIKGFEIFVYKDSALVKSGFKAVDSSNSVISINFDLKKDLSIVLMPETTYTYTIYVRTEDEINQDMYKQTFWFTTLSTKSDVPKQTTVTLEEQTTMGNPKTKVKKPDMVKIKSVKYSKKSIVVRWIRAKNAKKYQIQYSTSKKFKKVCTKTTKKLVYIVKKMKSNKTYYIRVRGMNGTKKGKWSKIKTVTIK